MIIRLLDIGASVKVVDGGEILQENSLTHLKLEIRLDKPIIIANALQHTKFYIWTADRNSNMADILDERVAEIIFCENKYNKSCRKGDGISKLLYQLIARTSLYSKIFSLNFISCSIFNCLAYHKDLFKPLDGISPRIAASHSVGARFVPKFFGIGCITYCSDVRLECHSKYPPPISPGYLIFVQWKPI